MKIEVWNINGDKSEFVKEVSVEKLLEPTPEMGLSLVSIWISKKTGLPVKKCYLVTHSNEERCMICLRAMLFCLDKRRKITELGEQDFNYVLYIEGL